MFQISVHHLSYGLPDGMPLFTDLNFSLQQQKVGLVGDNGVGKTSLLQLILGKRKPLSGTITVEGSLAAVHQQRTLVPAQKVAEFLGLADRLNALQRILAGEGSAADLVLLDDDWELEARISSTLGLAGLAHIGLGRQVCSLSGGELSRLALAAAWLSAPDFILMDEPTNHLDLASRKRIYEMIASTQAGLLVVSHDRELLRQMDHIIELSSAGIQHYGGNYDAYYAQKAQEQAAAAEALETAQNRLKRQEQKAREVAQRQVRRTSAAAQRAKGQRIPKDVLNYAKNRAESTQSRGDTQQEKRIAAQREKMQALRRKVDPNRQIQIDLNHRIAHASKALIQLESVQFAYPGAQALWSMPLNLSLYGTDRVWLRGPNGSGKSTLLQLIKGDLQATAGRVQLGTSHLAWLDQELALLIDSASLLENLQRFAPSGMETHELRTRLARFLFREDKVFQKAATLSGGERMRLGLACLLLADQTPELLILDEPTNNLDLRSIREMINVLNQYQGALLVISHDIDFIRELQVNKEWNLES
ncbi:MAG TPA: ABC-F family ATP-binding cassette domain-containing protein [Bacteroidetes bacterium]|nr:ABC-F family ATP-binding cassette domain-containing protein [Bacteroidota bacterium]